MKRITFLIFVIFAWLVSAPWLHAQGEFTIVDAPGAGTGLARVPCLSKLPMRGQLSDTTGMPIGCATASCGVPKVNLQPSMCQEQGQAAARVRRPWA